MSIEGNALPSVPLHAEWEGSALPASECDSEDFDASESAQYPLDDLDAIPDDVLENLRLKRKAKPLRVLDPTVVRSERGHRGYSAVCDSCGIPVYVLSHCGRPLCIPCQRKRVSRYAPLVYQAVLDVREWLALESAEHNTRWSLRFMTLTLAPTVAGQLAQGIRRLKRSYERLRRSVFWRDHNVFGDLPRVEFTLTKDGWHLQVHAIVAGGYLPVGPEQESFSSEGNLSEEWRAITGDSYIVDLRAVKDERALVRELVKYVFKPIDDMGQSIESWPEDARREAAEVLAGPYRCGWFCPTHHAREPRKCLDYIAPAGFVPVPCEGAWRKERQGFRPLLPSGVFRSQLAIVKETRAMRSWNCPACGLGRLHGESYWESQRRFGDPRAQSALNLILTHQMTDESPRRRLDLRAEAPSGWIPPPPYEQFQPQVRSVLVEILTKTPRDLDDLLHVLDCPDEHARMVELALLSLERLGIVYQNFAGVYVVNEHMMKRLRGDDRT